MGRYAFAALSLVAAILVSACQSGPDGGANFSGDSLAGDGFSGDDRAAISRAVTDWETAFNARNWDDLRALVTPDVRMLSQGGPAISDAQEYIEALEEFASQGSILAISLDDADGQGDFAYGIGAYDVTVRAATGRTIHLPGKWMAVFTKDTRGQWRIHRHIAPNDEAP